MKTHAAPLLILAVVLGGVIGYGVLMSFRRVYWTNHLPSATKAPTVAESLGPAAAAVPLPNVVSSGPPYAPETASAALDVRVDKGTSSPLAVSNGTPIGARPIGNPANYKASARPPASTSRSGKVPKNKDELIFGAEDLNW